LPCSGGSNRPARAREKRYKDRGTTQHDGFLYIVYLDARWPEFPSHVSSFVNAFFVLGKSLILYLIELKTSKRNPTVWNEMLETKQEGKIRAVGKDNCEQACHPQSPNL
jgi:hypothetical protein